MTEWPTNEWVRDNLWAKGCYTLGVSPQAADPVWYCTYCGTHSKKIINGNFNAALKHLRSAKHKENVTLEKLAST